MKNISIIVLISLSLSACFGIGGKTANKELGKRDIKYYADKSVAALEVPPDLTKPDETNALDVSDIVQVDETLADFSKQKKEKILTPPTGIVVKKDGNQRWLLVDKPANVIWNKVKKFLTNNGFVIEKSNKRIGLMETNFLENKPDIPKQSLGIIRSALKKALNQTFSTGIIDKYKVRLEPNKNGKMTEVFLTLISMEEVVTNEGSDEENTIWQPRKTDTGLEIEMLYRLMLFLGADKEKAKKNIKNPLEKKKIKVAFKETLGGNTKLIFPLNFKETWVQMNNALDKLNVVIDDKDILEGAFYIQTSNPENRNFLDKLFGKDAIKQTYQLLLKKQSNKETVVLFNIIGNEDVNVKKGIKYGKTFLKQIADTFK
ncbi:Outer membrane protein NlpB, lipoprotein component of the protein assembly complex (forms a complex with YaeT, YfiO, and YfgL); Lipoprotein-34 precursor [hydrothermal vent metagenome]|uniref:Outer membrane protein NlpB, lipoprotein component of the protein assembly complex (Forms a complex with YaeT, YfiO, and YfgL) Lipoprotein-34 n=1 Tax=hydrothermal vent metagenome TaxID=652676 RepID=A0A1W1BJB2_9ZZZZ